jgi:hypothetical protein
MQWDDCSNPMRTALTALRATLPSRLTLRCALHHFADSVKSFPAGAEVTVEALEGGCNLSAAVESSRAPFTPETELKTERVCRAAGG